MRKPMLEALSVYGLSLVRGLDSVKGEKYIVFHREGQSIYLLREVDKSIKYGQVARVIRYEKGLFRDITEEFREYNPDAKNEDALFSTLEPRFFRRKQVYKISDPEGLIKLVDSQRVERDENFSEVMVGEMQISQGHARTGGSRFG